MGVAEAVFAQWRILFDVGKESSGMTPHMRPTFPSPRWRALAALAAFLGLPLLAPAAIVQVDLATSPYPIPAELNGLFLNLVTGGTSSSAVPLSGWDLNPYHNGTGIGFFTPSTPANQGILTPGSSSLMLLGGEAIGPAGIYQAGTASGDGFFIGGIGYAGLRFQNELTGQLNYGWVKLRTTLGNGFPAAILGYAYEDTGAEITAGQVPEPHTGGFVLLSILTFFLHRPTRASSPRGD